MPDSYIPIVMHQEFEFIPFESALRNRPVVQGNMYAQADNGHNMQTIDIHNLTHA